MTDYTGTGQKEDFTTPDEIYGLLYDCGHRHKSISLALECKKEKISIIGEEPITPTKPSREDDITIPWSNEEVLRKKDRIPEHKPPNPKDQIGITKLRLDLIPPPALARLAKVMELGVKKYGPFNWRETEVNLTVYLAAGLRHTYSILDGEDIDPESGQHHAAHVAACMFIILDALELDKLIDDRPTPGNFAQLVTKLQEKL